jgi:hypothetical protein
MEVPWRKPSTRIHSTINITSRLPSPICPEEGREAIDVYRLLAAKQVDSKKPLPTTLDLATPGSTSRSVVVYMTGLTNGVYVYPNQGGWQVENGV